jgi:lysophospholipase L1-like esterase
VSIPSLTVGVRWRRGGLLALFAAVCSAQKYSIGPETPVYSKESGYGLDLGSSIGLKPFFFSVAVPEGNYDVTVTFGDANRESITTVKAESRRLMIERVDTAAGEFTKRTFTVNVHTPKIAGGGEVRLKPREIGILRWDDKLTLEFNGPRPAVTVVEIEKADAITVYLMGDSTVVDQPEEPWNSWGQMLTRFFKPGVAVANHAESGETLRGSTGEQRLKKVMSTIQRGDYLFIQFGHNDQKEKGEGIGAFTSYKADLKRYIAQAREHGATPVLVSPMNRRTFDADGKITNSLGDYPEAVRRAAEEESVALVDLNAMSKFFYEAMGAEESQKAFVDNTHHNNYGSYELAKCVVEGIKANKLALAKFLVDVPTFDPSHPDPVATFDVPRSPMSSMVKPDGN